MWSGQAGTSVGGGMSFSDDEILEALLRTKNGDRSRRHIDKKVVESLRGRRVRLVFTNDEYTDLEPGDHLPAFGGAVSGRYDQKRVM
jgi:hypothetical protein